MIKGTTGEVAWPSSRPGWCSYYFDSVYLHPGKGFFNNQRGTNVPIFSYQDLWPSDKYFTTDDGYNVLMVTRQSEDACWCSSMATWMNYLDPHLQMLRWYSKTHDSSTRIQIYRCVSPTYKWCNDAANPCTHRGRTKSNVANLDKHVFTTLHCKKHKMEKGLMFLSRELLHRCHTI